jgi:dihydrodipicolinate synthase/N-acetylneuraminate lyase
MTAERATEMNAKYITPAVTLFTDDGRYDAQAQAALYENLIKNHIDGILVQGSIGEFFAMSLEMRRDITRHAIETVNGRTRLIIGTACMEFERIAEYSNWCLDAGADAVMIVPPYYFPLDDEAVYNFFSRLAESIHGPMYLYNFPDRTGYSISVDTALRLAERYPNIVGIKDTVAAMTHTREVIKAIKPVRSDFEIFSGFDDNLAANALAGGDGCIAGLSNVAPEICVAWAHALNDGDVAGIQNGQQTINRMFDIYSVGSSFIPVIKEAVRRRGIIPSAACTFPIPEITPAQQERVAEILKREKLI